MTKMQSNLDKSPKGRKFPYTRAAEVLHMADLQPIAAVVASTGVSERTIHRWRARLAEDAELAFHYQKFVESRIDRVCEELPGVILAAMGWVTRACQAQDISNPDALKAMAGTLESLTQVLAFMAGRKSELKQKVYPQVLEG